MEFVLKKFFSNCLFVLMKMSFVYLVLCSFQHSLVVPMPSFYIPMKVAMACTVKYLQQLRTHPHHADRCDGIIQLAEVTAGNMSYLLAPGCKTRNLSIFLSVHAEKGHTILYLQTYLS